MVISELQKLYNVKLFSAATGWYIIEDKYRNYCGFWHRRFCLRLCDTIHFRRFVIMLCRFVASVQTPLNLHHDLLRHAVTSCLRWMKFCVSARREAIYDPAPGQSSHNSSVQKPFVRRRRRKEGLAPTGPRNWTIGRLKPCSHWRL